MSRTRRSLYRLLIGLLLACGAVQLTAIAVASAAPPDQRYVKYYTVAESYRGAPENLTEIAVRFLGDGTRSAEILTLNSGRRQPDGGTVADPATLRAGWSLMLPWDAVGDGVRYGLLPEITPSPVRQTQSPAPQAVPQSPAAPSSPRAPSPTPAPSSPGPVPPPPADGCGGAAPGDARSTWAQERLAADRAWATTRGGGVLVAVVDSGVDGSLPQLSGRVEAGADITAGGGAGDSDCLGSGTGMAAIIAGSPGEADLPAGLAPEAVILPIRVIDENGSDPADEATAIEVAVSAGAGVIAVGAHVDLADPVVSAAVSSALTHDVLVVVPAAQGPRPGSASGGGALLAVGAVDADGRLAGDAQNGEPDVVAPGVGVATLGVNGSGAVTGSGAQYAVAFAAGQAALVRAAHPTLTAAQVKHRIEATADRMGTEFGWGMINPAAAVTETVDGETPAPPADPDTGLGLGAALAIAVVALILLAAVALLVLRARRWAQGVSDDARHPDDDAR